MNESLGDEEKAYILYMKFFNVVTYARKSPDYKKQKVSSSLDGLRKNKHAMGDSLIIFKDNCLFSHYGFT